MAISGHDALFNIPLARALGLDPTKVQRIVLTVDVHEIVTAEVRLLPTRPEVEAMTKILEAVTWRERGA